MPLDQALPFKHPGNYPDIEMRLPLSSAHSGMPGMLIRNIIHHQLSWLQFPLQLLPNPLPPPHHQWNTTDVISKARLGLGGTRFNDVGGPIISPSNAAVVVGFGAPGLKGSFLLGFNVERKGLLLHKLQHVDKAVVPGRGQALVEAEEEGKVRGDAEDLLDGAAGEAKNEEGGEALGEGGVGVGLEADSGVGGVVVLLLRRHLHRGGME